MNSIKLLLLAALAVSAGVCFRAASDSALAMQQRSDGLSRAESWQPRFFVENKPEQLAAVGPAPMVEEAEEEIVVLPKTLRRRFPRKTSVQPVKELAMPQYKPEDVVRMALRSKRASFERCYENELKKQATFDGFIVVAFSVTIGGKVTGASLQEANGRDAVVGHCIVAQLRSLKLPALTSGADLVLPIRLQARST